MKPESGGGKGIADVRVAERSVGQGVDRFEWRDAVAATPAERTRRGTVQAGADGPHRTGGVDDAPGRRLAREARERPGGAEHLLDELRGRVRRVETGDQRDDSGNIRGRHRGTGHGRKPTGDRAENVHARGGQRDRVHAEIGEARKAARLVQAATAISFGRS